MRENLHIFQRDIVQNHYDTGHKDDLQPEKHEMTLYQIISSGLTFIQFTYG